MVADGLNGRTTAFDDHTADCDRNGARTLPTVLHSHAPLDLVILMLGTNDMKPVICGHRACGVQGYAAAHRTGASARLAGGAGGPADPGWWRRRRWSRRRTRILPRCSRAAWRNRPCSPRSTRIWPMTAARDFYGCGLRAECSSIDRRASGCGNTRAIGPRPGAGGAAAAGALKFFGGPIDQGQGGRGPRAATVQSSSTPEEMIDVAYAPRTGGGISRACRENERTETEPSCWKVVVGGGGCPFRQAFSTPNHDINRAVHRAETNVEPTDEFQHWNRCARSA